MKNFLFILSLVFLGNISTLYSQNLPLVATPPPERHISISFDEAQELGKKIWKNESNGKEEGLTCWNANEDFASLGIGHFIWYPPGSHKIYQETFPDLLAFMESCGAKAPEWIQKAPGCPWKSRDHFNRKKDSPQMNELRQYLSDTKALQAIYMTQRLEVSLAKMTAKLDTIEKRRLSDLFYMLAETKRGRYALVDYLNFKGEGLQPHEKYGGSGWGLLQVLQEMPKGKLDDPVAAFVASAKNVLARRVKNAPHGKQEQRWLTGWNNRLNTYLER